MSSQIPGPTTGYDIEGTRLQSAVDDALAKAAKASTTGLASPSKIPIPANPFLLSTVKTKKGRVRGEFAVILPDNSYRLTMTVCQTSLRTTQASFEANSLSGVAKIDPAQLAAQGFVLNFLFQPLLETNTQYDLVDLVVETITDTGGTTKAKNPDPAAVFNSPPLAQFTTGVFATGPQDPQASDIILNQIDPTLSDYVAEFQVRIWAPFGPTVAGQPTGQSWASAYIDAVVAPVMQLGNKVIHVNPYTITAADTQVATWSGIIGGNPVTVPNHGFILVSDKGLTPGLSCTWQYNLLNVGGEKSTSNVKNIAFIAGFFNTDPTTLFGVAYTGGVISGIGAGGSNPQLLSSVTNPPNLQVYDGKNVAFYPNWSQPNPPCALKNLKLFRCPDNTFAQSKLVLVDEISLKDPRYHLPGVAYGQVYAAGYVPDGGQNPKILAFSDAIKAVKAANNFFLMRIEAIGGATRDIQYIANHGGSSDGIGDLAAPSGLATPNIGFSDKLDIHISNMVVSTNYNQPADPAKFLVIYGPPVVGQPQIGGHTYLDIATYISSQGNTVQGAATELAARYPIGQKAKDTVAIRLKQVRQFYGWVNGGPQVLIHAYYYAQNEAFGISAASALANGPAGQVPAEGLDLQSPFDNVDSSGGVNVDNVGMSLISTVNVLSSGDFRFARSGGAAKSWLVGTGVPIPQIGGGNPLEFDNPNHRLVWTGPTIGPGQKLGDPSNNPANTGYTVKPGQFYTLGMTMYALVPWTPTFNLIFETPGPGFAQPINLPFTVSLGTTPQLVQVKFQIPQNPALPAAQYFFAGGWLWMFITILAAPFPSPTNNVFIEEVQLNAGQQQTAFSLAPVFETDSNLTGSVIDATPNYTGAQSATAASPTGPQVGITTRTQGSGFVVGSGGGVSPGLFGP